MEIGTLMEWLLLEFDNALSTRIDQIPKKCRDGNQLFPHFLWYGLPFNINCRDNQARICFNKTLEQIVPKFPNMSLILPKKGWDEFDRSVCLNDSFTAKGIAMYWKAIDAGALSWDMKKQNQTIQKSNIEEDDMKQQQPTSKIKSAITVPPPRRPQEFNFPDFKMHRAANWHDGKKPWNFHKKTSNDRFHWFKHRLLTPPPINRRQQLFK